MTNMTVKTVKVVAPVSVKNPHGYIVINESDITQDHELFVEISGQSIQQTLAPVAQVIQAPVETIIESPTDEIDLVDAPAPKPWE
jgi:hypothetical protein